MIYNSKDVSVVVKGIPITGFSKEIVKIEPVQKESIKTESGAQGDFVHSQNHDKRVKVTLSLWQNSPSLKTLQELLKTKEDFPILIKNSSDGAYIGAANSCVVTERLSVSFGSEIKEVQVVITAADYEDTFI